MHSKSACVACGPAPVNHFLEKTITVFNWLTGPWEHLMERVWARLQPIFKYFRPDWLAPIAYKTATAMGLGEIIKSPDSKNGGRAKVFWEEALKRGYQMFEFRPFGRAAEIFFIKGPGLKCAFTGLPLPRRYSAGFEWMDNKGVMREKFKAAEIPVAHGGTCFTRHRAKKIFEEIEKPVIVKPVVGSRSRHTTIHITTLEQLEDAIKVVKQISPWFVVEEELVGFVHRALVIGGKLFGVLRREPPHVVGNGRSTIKELLEKENQNPRRDGKIFHKIPGGLEAEDELKLQGFDWHSIPEKDRMVFLHQKISRSNGATNTDVTDEVHLDNAILFEKVARVLDTDLVGIDFIISDITKSWKVQAKSGVIECNSLPFIDLHHYPFDGKPRNAAGALLDLTINTR